MKKQRTTIQASYILICLCILMLSLFLSSCATETNDGTFTLMIMMNGSDLETDAGNATDDILELMDSGFNADRLQVLLLTCGTSEWQNDVISAELPVIWRAYDDGLEELFQYPERISVGNPDLLSSFVSYCYENYPADRYGLVFWNHGGGPILGYGADEWFDGDSLLLPDLATALDATPATRTPFAFVGFDACLMGSLETALVLQDYADYLIASEELEPGTGWDYGAFRRLADDPSMPVEKFGEILVDAFIDTNRPSWDMPTGDTATLSVVDLKAVEDVAVALEAVARHLTPVTLEEYPALARARFRLRSFGDGGPQGTDADLIDLEKLARQFDDALPEQSFALRMALEKAIVYSGATANLSEQASGLSVYFPFSEKGELAEYLAMYRNLGILPSYTLFIEDFATILNGEPLYDISFFFVEEPDDLFIGITPASLEYVSELNFELWQQEEESDTAETYWYIQLARTPVESISEESVIVDPFVDTWITLEDQFACLYMLDRTPTGARYAIPAYLNDEDVNIIIVYDETFPDGIVVGAVPVEQDAFAMPARSMLSFHRGDILELQYRAILMSEDDRELTDEEYADEIWYVGEPITLSGRPTMGTAQVGAGIYRYCYVATDLQQNQFASDYIAVTFE